MKNRSLLMSLLLSICAAVASFAQSQKPLTNSDIVNMTKQGFAARSDLVDFSLGENVSTGEVVTDVLLGRAIGKAGEVLRPGVIGGNNFNPLTSPRTFGPKALQLYGEEEISHGLEYGKEIGKQSTGRDCGCKN